MSNTTELIEVKRSDSGWEMTLNGFSDPVEVGKYLWPNGVPSGVKITPLVVVTEPSVVGTFQLTGLTLDALQTMDQDAANQFSEASVVTADPASSDSTDTSSTKSTNNGAAPDVHMDESELREWVQKELDGAEAIGDASEIAGFFAAEGSTLAAIGEVLGPIGPIAGTITVLGAVIHAFGTGRRLMEQRGFCYGVMWETFGMSDNVGEFQPWAGDTAEELHDAFMDGVSEGREKARETKVHNAIVLKVAYEIAADPCDKTSAQQNVINELWLKIRETDSAEDSLPWPKFH